MANQKLTAKAFLKIVVLTILACIGFFVLWGITFIVSYAFTVNIALSLIPSFLISAITIFALITVLIPPRRRIRLTLSKRQTAGVYVAWGIIFVLSLPLIKINPRLFLGYLPTLVGGTFIVIYGTLRRRKGKEMQK